MSNYMQTIQFPDAEGNTMAEVTLVFDSPILRVTNDIRRQAIDAGVRLLTENEYQKHVATAFEQGRDMKEEGLRMFLRAYLTNNDMFDTCVDLFNELGWPAPTRKWLVTVDIDGQRVLEVVVEADDEEDAVSMVEQGLSVETAYVTVEYSGPGDVEDSNEYEADMDYLLDGSVTVDISAEEYFD